MIQYCMHDLVSGAGRRQTSLTRKAAPVACKRQVSLTRKAASTPVKAFRSSACPLTFRMPRGTRSLHSAMDLRISLLHAMGSILSPPIVQSSHGSTPCSEPYIHPSIHIFMHASVHSFSHHSFTH